MHKRDLSVKILSVAGSKSVATINILPRYKCVVREDYWSSVSTKQTTARVYIRPSLSIKISFSKEEEISLALLKLLTKGEILAKVHIQI